MSSSGGWFISHGASADDKSRVATIKKDTYNNANSASAFLAANSSQHFAQPVPDYSARGDINARSFFIYRGNAPVAEVRFHTTVTVLRQAQRTFAAFVATVAHHCHS